MTKHRDIGPADETEAAWKSLRPRRERPDKGKFVRGEPAEPTGTVTTHFRRDRKPTESRQPPFYSTLRPDELRQLGGSEMSRLQWLLEGFTLQRVGFTRRGRQGDNAGWKWPNDVKDDQTPTAVARECWLFLLYQNGVGTMTGAQPPVMPVRRLRALSEAIQRGVERLLSGQDWIVKVPAQTARRARSQQVLLGRDKGQHRATASWVEPTLRGRAFELAFLLGAQDLIVSQFKWVARCPGCETVFVREDLRQNYHSNQCGAAARKRVSRKAQRDALQRATETAKTGKRKSKNETPRQK